MHVHIQMHLYVHIHHTHRERIQLNKSFMKHEYRLLCADWEKWMLPSPSCVNVHKLQTCTSLCLPPVRSNGHREWPANNYVSKIKYSHSIKMECYKNKSFTIIYRAMKTWSLYYHPVMSRKAPKNFIGRRCFQLKNSHKDNFIKICISIISKYLERLD